MILSEKVTEAVLPHGGRRVTRSVVLSLLLGLLAASALSCDSTTESIGADSDIGGLFTMFGARVPVGRLVADTEGHSGRAGELFLFSVGNEPRQLSDIAGMPGKPSYATGGRRRPDGSEKTFLIPTVVHAELSDAAISPDGRKVVYFLRDPFSDEGLWLLEIEGAAQPVRLTRGNDYYPCWSPDGKTIAFVRTTWTDGMKSRTEELLKVSVDPPHTVEVLAKVERADGILWPAWSPDGKTLLFERRKVVPPEGFIRRVICRVDLTSGEVSELPIQALSAGRPAWFPDGSRIAYCATKGGSWNIYASKPNGDDEQLLAGTGRDETDPTISPDGRYVAFLRTSGKYGKFDRIYIRDLQTGAVSLLTPPETIGWDTISWGPAPPEEDTAGQE